MDLIVTHRKCPDGWCAAYIAKKKYPEAEILSLDHGEPVPFDKVAGKSVIVTDFSWPNREDNIKLHDSANYFHIYDHHKSAKERIGDLPFVTFDMTRSGAGIVWDYLFGKDFCTDCGKERPWYVNYVEDRDLWNHDLPGTKSINAFLMGLPMTIEAWDTLENLCPTTCRQFGSHILNHIDRYVMEAVDELQYGSLTVGEETFKIAVVNAPYMNCSEVGNVLAQKADIGMTWFERADGQVQFSLRSVGAIDVSTVAKHFNGGGHLHASGFRMSLAGARELLDHILRA